jgi:hypothetical protein
MNCYFCGANLVPYALNPIRQHCPDCNCEGHIKYLGTPPTTESKTPLSECKHDFLGNICLLCGVDFQVAQAARIASLETQLAAKEKELEKNKATLKFICGAHIGTTHVVLTENFSLGCPCCHRDEANLEIKIQSANLTQLQAVARGLNKELRQELQARFGFNPPLNAVRATYSSLPESITGNKTK